MSNTAILGDWSLLERLTNDEFLAISPHLNLEEYVLTEVFIPKKKWIPLLDANLQTLQARCNVCKQNVRFEDVKDHIKHNDHLMLLRSNVKQFYHPFYTYGKIDIKLARGEDAPNDLRQTALREVNMQMKGLKKECIFAKKVSEAAERRSWETEEEQLIAASLSKTIINPDEIIVVANLPVEDIGKVLFRLENKEWQTMFSYKSLAKKAPFHCKICSVNCSGIESLNSHLYDHVHSLRQLELYAVCYEYSSRLNKNCCIQFGHSFSFSIKDCARNSYRRRNCDTWISRLPTKVAKKFKPLNDVAVKMFEYPEHSVNERSRNKDYETFNSDVNLGHLGVEYVLKIMKSENDRDPEFECGLCEFFGDGNKMQRHILCLDHQKKYLDLHYCDTIKKYESLVSDLRYEEFVAVMREIVHKISFAIENHHSRSLPYTVSLADYKTRRRDLISDVYALLHASQMRGPSFSNAVSKEHLRHLKKSANLLASREISDYHGHVIFTIPPKHKTYLNQMSHDPVSRMKEYSAKLVTNRPLRTSRSISPVHDHMYNALSRSDSPLERSHGTIDKRRTRSRSPIHEDRNSKRGTSNDVFYTSNRDIWDIYRREIAHAANKIELAYESFRKNPESHPLYEDEWNSFWQRRKKELEREGYDHRSYNFQPEWVQYFKQRIEILFGETLHKSQIDIRHRLKIPLDAEEDCQRPSEVTNQHHKNRRSGKMDEEYSEFKRDNIIRQRSPDSRSYDLQNKRMFVDQREKEYLNKSQMIISKINDNHSNVVHVLRLMTAMEEYLGSLGGRIMDLLSKALQLEKYYGNNNEFEKRILTSENCNLLETAMEKLKGILFSELLDEKKLSGFNRVITYTTNLLKYAEKMGWRQENILFDKKDFHSNAKSNADQYQHLLSQGSIDDTVSKPALGKPLSDTLMDLAKTSQSQMSKQQNVNHSKQYVKLAGCPPPPNLHEPAVNSNLFPGPKGQIPNSGLASFDTKLSLDEAHLSRTVRRDLPHQRQVGPLQRQIVSGGNSVYNNSFRSNNETRTNTNSRAVNGTQFFISKTIPNMGQNNTMYQGVDGGNHNKNWMQWDQTN